MMRMITPVVCPFSRVVSQPHPPDKLLAHCKDQPYLYDNNGHGDDDGADDDDDDDDAAADDDDDGHNADIKTRKGCN